jgi:hypothetical protein
MNTIELTKRDGSPVFINFDTVSEFYEITEATVLKMNFQ